MRRLYARDDYRTELNYRQSIKEAQTNLQAFRCALNRSAEISARVLYADAMYPRQLQVFLEHLRRRQARLHLRGHQWHECSTRRVGSLGI